MRFRSPIFARAGYRPYYQDVVDLARACPEAGRAI